MFGRSECPSERLEGVPEERAREMSLQRPGVAAAFVGALCLGKGWVPPTRMTGERPRPVPITKGRHRCSQEVVIGQCLIGAVIYWVGCWLQRPWRLRRQSKAIVTAID